MNIEEILFLVKKPGRYLGREINAWQKRWEDAKARFCCVFPDLYEIGMSHQGLAILYHILNRQNHYLADRCYCPDTDMERLLRENKIPIFSLDSRKALSLFDALLITLPYELCYTNIFTILSLSNIPFFSNERQEGNWPIIIGGGSCCLNPEPVADMFDAIVIGDGEEVLLEIASIIERAKESKGSRGELLKELSHLRGVYVPSFYNPVYEKDTTFKGMEVKHGAPCRIRRRLIPELRPEYEIDAPLVPNIRIVHDRLGVEIARGCTRGCRYCQATSIYRPVREKSIEQITQGAIRGIDATGWEELSLLSLSTGDYSGIEPLIHNVMEEFVPRHCSVSLPSLRVGTLTPEIMEQIKKVRKTGITLAPEAGSERLRAAINKGITEKDLLDTVKNAFQMGWKNVKLYFMIGLPGEEDQDLFELIELVKKVRAQAKKIKGLKGSVQVTASIGTFVPKPQTPFQWEGQIPIDESRRRLEIIKRGLKNRAFKVKWHDPRQSFLEGVFSRGDRRLSRLLHLAWEKGARLDAWTDNLRPEIYQKAASELGIDLTTYLKARDEDAPLYWDHIDSGISKSFLRLERRRAKKLAYTPDCRYNDCQGCGVCDFKTIKNVLKGRNQKVLKVSKQVAEPPLPQQSYHYLVEYQKVFDSRFIGHLDTVRLFHRAIRRAKIPVCYSKGFHPMPKVSFQDPIPLGMESMRERFVMELCTKVDQSELKTRLNRQLSLDLSIKKVTACTKKEKIESPALDQLMVIVPLGNTSAEKALRALNEKNSVDILIRKKDKEITTDIKRRIVKIALLRKYEPHTQLWISKAMEQISAKEKSVLLLEIDQATSPRLKPFDVIKALFGLDEKDLASCRFLRF